LIVIFVIQFFETKIEGVKLIRKFARFELCIRSEYC